MRDYSSTVDVFRFSVPGSSVSISRILKSKLLLPISESTAPPRTSISWGKEAPGCNPVFQLFFVPFPALRSASILMCNKTTSSLCSLFIFSSSPISSPSSHILHSNSPTNCSCWGLSDSFFSPGFIHADSIRAENTAIPNQLDNQFILAHDSGYCIPSGELFCISGMIIFLRYRHYIYLFYLSTYTFFNASISALIRSISLVLPVSVVSHLL